MRCTFFLLVVLSCSIHAEAAVQITEFCPDPYQFDDADEYIILSGDGSLDGITISDGNGGFRFPEGTRINGSVTIARSGPAFQQTHSKLPDFEWQDNSPLVHDVLSGRTLRMANAKDSLMLYKNGQLIQIVAWPGDVKPREGQVHYLENNTWDPRPLMIGQSRFAPAEFINATVTTFVAPDSSGEIFSGAIGNASSEVLLNIYEFSSQQMAEMLIASRQRGVDVGIFLEGGPVGGISPEEDAVILRLTENGVPVHMMVSRPGAPAPYRYNHAKYVVIDRFSTLLTSENFKNSGFPPPGKNGNRGWGVLIEHPDLAEYFRVVYSTDINGCSVTAYNGSKGAPEIVPASNYAVKFPPKIFSDAIVKPVLAPDTSSQISALINSAEKSIEIEQAYITNDTRLNLNPYLSAAINASRRGVDVRILLDSFWFNVGDENDNDEMVDIINRIAATERIPLEARTADLPRIGVEKIHNKGVIVDDERVLVSSINWNSVSPNFNREAGVIIDHPEVALYFRSVFDNDWNASTKISRAQTDYWKMGVIAGVLLVLLIIYLQRRNH